MNLRELSSYSDLAQKLARAEGLLRSMREASKPASTVIDGMPRAADVKEKVENLAIEMADLEASIARLKSDACRERRRAEKFIADVPDERARVALRLKYLRGLTWEQAAELMGNKYSAEGIKKMCYKALL